MFKIKSYGICLYKTQGKKVKILLCSSISNAEKWGCLKGGSLRHETPKRVAQREFFEESSIFVQMSDFEKYYEQKNDIKDIGIWLVNYKNVQNAKAFFKGDKLKQTYMCDENSHVKFFDIEALPKIKSKQKRVINLIKAYLIKRFEL